MNYSNFSSIFELLCAYNFVNVVNDSEALKFLDLGTPAKDQVLKLIGQIEGYLQRLPMNQGGWENGRLAVTHQNQVREVGNKIASHKVRAGNLYLVGGIFCFFTLLCTGLIEEFNKSNSLPFVLFGTWLLYFLFIQCESPNHQPIFKFVGTFFIGLIGVYCFIQQFLSPIPGLGGFQHLFFVIGTLCLAIVLLVFFRTKFTKRLLYKTIFITLCFIAIISPKTKFFWGEWEKYSEYNVFALVQIVSFIATALFPIIYDIAKNNLFTIELRPLLAIVSQRYFSAELAQNNVDLTEEDTNPFNPQM